MYMSKTCYKYFERVNTVLDKAAYCSSRGQTQADRQPQAHVCVHGLHRKDFVTGAAEQTALHVPEHTAQGGTQRDGLTIKMCLPISLCLLREAPSFHK